MQHRFISYENACELIDHLDAIEIHSTGWSQTFRAERAGQPIYIQLTGECDCLVIEQPLKLRLAKTSH